MSAVLGVRAISTHATTDAGTREARPWLSIVSTNYNCAHALEAHLNSIYDQFRDGEFEYVVVDNRSKDRSLEILRRWAADHANFRWSQRRCTRGTGRELAVRMSSGRFLLAVDTDTIYSPILRLFVDRATTEYGQYAVQAIYAGVFPRSLWQAVGGSANLNTGEDFEMWMRLWRVGRMRWYPKKMGENRKEPGTADRMDFRSPRYGRGDRLKRLLRMGFDRLQLVRYERLDLERIWKENSIDFGLGTLEPTWFGDRRPRDMSHRFVTFLRSAVGLLQ